MPTSLRVIWCLDNQLTRQLPILDDQSQFNLTTIKARESLCQHRSFRCSRAFAERIYLHMYNPHQPHAELIYLRRFPESQLWSCTTRERSFTESTVAPAASPKPHPPSQTVHSPISRRNLNDYIPPLCPSRKASVAVGGPRDSPRLPQVRLRDLTTNSSSGLILIHGASRNPNTCCRPGRVR